MVGMIGQLGLAQAFQSHVIFPVQEGNFWVFQSQVTGEFGVDGIVGAVHVLPCFFKVDIKGVFV